MAFDTVAERSNELPSFIWDEALIRRYDLSGPRYTSYPTAVEFTAEFGPEAMAEAAAAAGRPAVRCRCIRTCRSARTCAITVPATK